MNHQEKTRIRANLTSLREIPVDELETPLYSKGVIDDDDIDSFQAIGMTPLKASEKLFRTIILKGKCGDFTILCRVLIDIGYEHSVRQMEDTDVTQYNFDFNPSPTQKYQKLFQQMMETSEDIVAENARLKSQLLEKETAEREARLKQSQLNMNPNVQEFIKNKIQQPDTPASVNSSGDSVDSGIGGSFIPSRLQQWMALRNPVMNSSQTETIARELGADIVAYICFDNPPQPRSKYASVLRRVVDAVLSRNKDKFDGFISNLFIDEINGLQTLWDMAEVLFKDCDETRRPNWGQVVTFYAFGAFVAKNSFSDDVAPQMAHFIGDFLGYFISKRLGQSINRHGGWEAFYDHFQPSYSYSSQLLIISGVLAVVLAYKFFRSPEK